jgi:hypothetical protein
MPSPFFLYNKMNTKSASHRRSGVSIYRSLAYPGYTVPQHYHHALYQPLALVEPVRLFFSFLEVIQRSEGNLFSIRRTQPRHGG